MTPKILPENYYSWLISLAKCLDAKLTQQSVALLYSNDKWVEQEIWETIPFTIVTNNIKFLCLTLSKQGKEVYKNFKSLKKELRKVSEDGKIANAHGLVGLHSKNGHLPKSIQHLQCNSDQNSKTILCRPWMNSTQSHMEKQTPRTAKSTLAHKKNLWSYHNS